MKKKGILDGYKTYDTSGGYGNPAEWKENFEQRMGKDQAQAILDQQAESPYTLLGVTPQASQADIKTAYHKRLMEWHPDKNPDSQDEAKAMTIKIIAAFSVLYKD